MRYTTYLLENTAVHRHASLHTRRLDLGRAPAYIAARARAEKKPLELGRHTLLHRTELATTAMVLASHAA